jgi:hypothetical protein
MEYASTVHARAAELTMQLQRLEREGRVLKNSKHYKFRTGELRTFMELCQRAAELGSRRITVAKMEYDKYLDGQYLDGSR